MVEAVSAIKVGDLVMMVRGHSCLMKIAGGVPFTVTGILSPFGGGWTCPLCQTINAAGNENASTGAPGNASIPLSWLIKIEPGADEAKRETQRELETT